MKSFIIRHKIISTLQDIDVKGIRKISHSLPKLLIPKPTKKIVLKTIYGFYMEIDPIQDNGVEKSLYYTGTYEKGTLSVIKTVLNKGETFVDIGANIGLMSIFASFVVGNKGKVIGFEPNPVTRDIFNNNIKLNSIQQIEVSENAIGQKKEEGRLYDRWDSNRGSASLIKPANETQSYAVEICSLSDYCLDETQIHLIKIDVEGFELEVLKGSLEILKRADPPMLIVECSETRENSEGSGATVIYDFIKAANDYKVFKSIGGKERISKLIEVKEKADLPNHDNIYCFTEQHLKNIPAAIFK